MYQISSQCLKITEKSLHLTLCPPMMYVNPIRILRDEGQASIIQSGFVWSDYSPHVIFKVFGCIAYRTDHDKQFSILLGKH